MVVAYWALWFGHRSVVAVETGTGYVQFEEAFPAADAWLVVCLVLGALALAAGAPRPSSSWSPGPGRAVPVLHGRALRHRARRVGRGANGLTELAIDATRSSAGRLRWAWRRGPSWVRTVRTRPTAPVDRHIAHRTSPIAAHARTDQHGAQGADDRADGAGGRRWPPLGWGHVPHVPTPSRCTGPSG